MPADEYYVANRYAYGNYHYVRGNVVHVLDAEKQTINMLIYKGTLEDAVVAYREAEKALISDDIKKLYYNDFMIHRKNYRCYPEHFNLKTVIRTLKEYRDGIDTYAHYGNVDRHNVKEGRIYGLKIYDEILNKEDVFQKFMRDRRCSYIMAEHKRIMLKRLAYLNDNGILKNEEYVIHKDDYEEISRLAEQVCLLVVKNRIKSSEQISNKVWDILKEVKEKETNVLRLLIEDLERNL